MESSQVATVCPNVYKNVLSMIKELRKMVLKWIRQRETCSPSLIQMFEGTKRWFMEQVKIHFADSQKRYLQWRWRSAEKMFLQFREGKALTAASPALPIGAANAAPLPLPIAIRSRKMANARGKAAKAAKTANLPLALQRQIGEAANASTQKRQRKRIKVAEPPQLSVIPE
jgi:hypothetical protein